MMEMSVAVLGDSIKKKSIVDFFNTYSKYYMMRNYLYSVIFLFVFATESFAATQDSLISFDDVEFFVSEDTAALIEEPDDLLFSNGEETSGNIIDVEGKATIENISTDDPTAKRSLWGIFIAGLLGGFAAFLMPCIFPMLPLTVSFFTKRSDSKRKGISKALIYGLFIIIIYVALGMLITIAFGSDALNALSTNGIFNFAFFLILVVFAASFFGAFEITLPSTFVNKIDSKSDKGGFVGLFFMAFSLALVSFSCTGPIIGTLLVEAASNGERLGPAIGMLGFSITLAIPFIIFAIFPSMLKSMPKSGSWLNSVKVVLGFLELALALKFLSNVDLAYHWNWLDREVFLALWIAIFGLLGLYLIGVIKFAHDGNLHYMSVFRTIFAIISFSFVIYMIPGMWGAPLKSISAFLPPLATQDFDLSTGNFQELSSHSMNDKKKKYFEIFHERGTPKGFDPYYDYDEGLAAAKAVNKPIFIDFTGWNCVNCRKMEANVWTDPKVATLLKEEFVMIELFTDDKTSLSTDEQYVSTYSGQKITKLGKKFADLQASKFNNNSQPMYAILDTAGNILQPPIGADFNVDSYTAFLEKGVRLFKNKQ